MQGNVAFASLSFADNDEDKKIVICLVIMEIPRNERTLERHI